MAKMENKKKACCENCDKCDKRDFRCSQTGSLVNKCEYCSYYYGDGKTPEQRIAELEAENAELKTRVQQFEHKEICVKENAEKLDAKESEVQMKDKNGIEIKCENCEYRKPCLECDTCENGGFTPKRQLLEARIAELEAELKRREFKPIVEADFKVSPQFPKERELFRGKYKIVDTGEELFAVFVKDSLEYSAYTLDEINKWAVKQIAKLNKEQKELGGCDE